MTLRDRIKDLCKKNKISLNQLEINLDFGKGYLSKLDKNKPNVSNLEKIADYFNITLDYLMTGEEKKLEVPEFENEHIELITLYSQLEKEQKEAVFNLLRSFALK